MGRRLFSEDPGSTAHYVASKLPATVSYQIGIVEFRENCGHEIQSSAPKLHMCTFAVQRPASSAQTHFGPVFNCSSTINQ